MVLARPRCEVVGVTRLNVIWVEIFSAGQVWPVYAYDHRMGRLAEMVDPHCAHMSKRGGGQQVARTTSAESTRRHCFGPDHTIFPSITYGPQDWLSKTTNGIVFSSIYSAHVVLTVVNSRNVTHSSVCFISVLL